MAAACLKATHWADHAAKRPRLTNSQRDDSCMPPGLKYPAGTRTHTKATPGEWKPKPMSI